MIKPEFCKSIARFSTLSCASWNLIHNSLVSPGIGVQHYQRPLSHRTSQSFRCLAERNRSRCYPWKDPAPPWGVRNVGFRQVTFQSAMTQYTITTHQIVLGPIFHWIIHTSSTLSHKASINLLTTWTHKWFVSSRLPLSIIQVYWRLITNTLDLI